MANELSNEKKNRHKDKSLNFQDVKICPYTLQPLSNVHSRGRTSLFLFFSQGSSNK